MLDSITGAQFAGWAAYYELEPWGEQAAQGRSAVLHTLLANIWGKRGKRWKVADWMPPDPARAGSPTAPASLSDRIKAAMSRFPRSGE